MVAAYLLVSAPVTLGGMTHTAVLVCVCIIIATVHGIVTRTVV